MKKKLLSLAVLIAAAVGLMSMASSDNNAVNPTTIPVPSALETKVINTAVNHHFISASDANILYEKQAIQRSVNAFVASGFEPSAAVDELADIAVESGKFKTTKAAKQAMRRSIEKARKNEANWAALYKICGL